MMVRESSGVDGRGDACDILITGPLATGPLEGSDPVNVRPSVTWDPGVYDRFRVEMGRAGTFATGTKITSGVTLLKTPACTPPARKLKKLCQPALAADPGSPTVFVRVYGKDASAPKADLGKTTFSGILEASVIP